MPSHFTRTLIPLVVAACAIASATTRGQTRPNTAAPTTFDPVEKSIEELERAMESRQVTSRQLVDIYLARIDAYDQQGPALNAVKIT